MGTIQGDLRASVPRHNVLDWLLEPDQPSVRYLALTRLVGRKETDPEVREAKAFIPSVGCAADILSRRDPAGWWVRDRGWLEPRFTGTHWNMLALADLGATSSVPEVSASAEYWMAKSPLQGGGVGGFGKGKGHHCYTANMARGLLRLGYAEDPRVRKTLDWLVKTAHPKGGLVVPVREGRTRAEPHARRMGGIGCLRGLSALEVDPGDERRRRADRRVLP
jgi:hypothetical protein